MNKKGTTMESRKERLRDIERTMEAYRYDPVIPADPTLAARIAAQEGEQVIASRWWMPELRSGEIIVTLSFLINIVAMVVVLGLDGRHEERDPLAQLRTEYDVENTITK